MTDEEKEAIEIQDSISILENTDLDINNVYSIDLRTYNIAVKTVLNLIEELKEDLKKKPIFLIKDIYSPKLKEINLQDAEGLIEQGREEVRDKIKAKIEEIDNEYSNKILSNDKMSLDLVNINTQRHNAMKLVLEELLEKE